MLNTKNILVGMIILALLTTAQALINPAAAYCSRLGYTYAFEETDEGTMSICKLPNGENCEIWKFSSGECGIEYSYCAIKGYEQEIQEDSDICIAGKCVVCILPDGKKQEATSLSREDTALGPKQSLKDIPDPGKQQTEPAVAQNEPTSTYRPLEGNTMKNIIFAVAAALLIAGVAIILKKKKPQE